MKTVVMGMMIVLSLTSGAFAADAEKVNNTICPVSGEKVGEMGDVVEHVYKNKVYHLCCSMCIEEFDKDPEKYSKIAEEQAGQSQ